MPQFRTLGWPAQLYVVAASAFSICLVLLGWFVHPVAVRELPTLVYLAVMTQIAALLPIRWRDGVQTVADPLLLATGLYAPGAGVGAVVWLATFDGRLPGRNFATWVFIFNRGMHALAHVVPSLIVMTIATGAWWNLPVRTAAYVAMSVAINYLMAARAVSFANKTSFWATLAQNVAGLRTLTSTAALSFSGGILYLLVQTPVGYLMAPGLFGFVLAVRGNVADAQRQTELKDQTLDLAAQALDARDRYTESHSKRVAELAGQLGDHLELGGRECELLRTAGSLHDLGKIGVRDDILNKPGPLTDDEWQAMRRHPDIGADMIAQHSALAEVAPLVRHHHERWDGSGYPAGLKGAVIPFGARILAVADSFDTITGTRLYRRSLMTSIEGVEDISRRAGLWYDLNVVDALRAIHGLEPLDLADRPDVPRRITAFRVMRGSPALTKLLAAIGISALGDPMTQVATLVSIYAATGKPVAVALGFIAQALGTILMSGALGGVADRLPRRPLVVTLELVRAATLIATPFLVGLWLWLLLPVLFVLAAINAVVQPARQAAVPLLVAPGQVGKANAITATVGTVSGAVGFALAGGILALFHGSTTILFFADAATFAVAAAIVLSIPGLGGGTASMRVTGAIRRVWSMGATRPHLAVAAFAALFISMSFPALLTLAYNLSKHGAQTYSVLEVVLSAGIFAGSLVVGRAGSIGSMRTAGAGLFICGLFTLAMTFSPSLLLVGAALFVASIGNPIYSVANQTALVEVADPANRGSVMATRFGIVQTVSIAGTAVGGLVTQEFGAIAAYGVLAVGLILLGMFALAAGRTTTNPLHGSAYEASAVAVPPPQTGPQSI